MFFKGYYIFYYLIILKMIQGKVVHALAILFIVNQVNLENCLSEQLFILDVINSRTAFNASCSWHKILLRNYITENIP
jgi:hypothetical protein